MIHFNDDISFALDHQDIACRYAMAFLNAAHHAEYVAAIIEQMTVKLGLPHEAVAQVGADFRAMVGRDTWKAGPVEVTPGVSIFTRKPFLRCQVQEMTWQWTPADVRDHVQGVLDVSAAAELDSMYRHYLITTIGIEPERAPAIVADIANHREDQPQ